MTKLGALNYNYHSSRLCGRLGDLKIIRIHLSKENQTTNAGGLNHNNRYMLLSWFTKHWVRKKVQQNLW